MYFIISNSIYSELNRSHFFLMFLQVFIKDIRNINIFLILMLRSSIYRYINMSTDSLVLL